MGREYDAGVLGRCIVVIPALSPDPKVTDYVSALLDKGFRQVVVVDDGSGEAFAGTFYTLEGMEGCTVLRHEKNRGKGRALKTAFAHILNCPLWEGSAVVTADADGQHSVEDVCAVAAAAAAEEKRLVMGVRDLSLPNVPTRSKIGNRVTSWAFHLLYGVRLEDTQTGLRGIPWGLLRWCAGIEGDRFEYEMNMLIKAAREHVELRQVSIEVIYYDNNAGSHLHTVRDAWRVFCILMAGLGWYTAAAALAAAALSAAADVLTFWLGSAVIFRPLSDLACYWWSTLTARALSSTLNYSLNRRYVFGAKPRPRTVVRYYCLWLGQLMCSYLLLLFMTVLIPSLPPVVSKALVDILLAIGSYQIQMHWVFREEDEDEER